MVHLIRRWGLDQIRVVDRRRPAWLPSAGSPLELISELREALSKALANPRAHRLAIDSIEDRFEARRTIVQFQVTPDLYDWFFNGRTGYRAMFLASAYGGFEFNAELVRQLTVVIQSFSGSVVSARKIQVMTERQPDGSVASREETDLGTLKVPKEMWLGSLVPTMSKVWICERRSKKKRGPVEPIWLSVLGEPGPPLEVTAHLP